MKSYLDLKRYFECDLDAPRPIISQSTWRHARAELYHGVNNHPSKVLSDGFFVPVEAKKAPGKGRVFFATEDIEKGTLIWNPSREAHFTTPAAFKDYLMQLYTKVGNDFVCDALNFVYVQKVKKKKSADGDVDIDEDGVDFEMQPVISIDLDEGGLCNNYDES